MRILSYTTLNPETAQPPSATEFEKMGAFIEELRERGILVETGGAMDDMVEMHFVRKDGKTTITDGPFTESKEVVGGYAVMDVADKAQAIELTKRFLEIVGGDATCHVHEVSIA
jgi:hypothetical protein